MLVYWNNKKIPKETPQEEIYFQLKISKYVLKRCCTSDSESLSINSRLIERFSDTQTVVFERSSVNHQFYLSIIDTRSSLRSVCQNCQLNISSHLILKLWLIFYSGQHFQSCHVDLTRNRHTWSYLNVNSLWCKFCCWPGSSYQILVQFGLASMFRDNLDWNFRVKIRMPLKISIICFMICTITLGPAYNEQIDAKKSTRCRRVLLVTELVVSGTQCTKSDPVVVSETTEINTRSTRVTHTLLRTSLPLASV